MKNPVDAETSGVQSADSSNTDILLMNVPRFDMQKEPVRQRFYLRPLTWLLSFPEVWLHRTKIKKTGMSGLKPPYMLLCTHMSFFDFKVTTAAIFPHRANYIVAIDGFIGREGLLRNVGCICKRKFTNDVRLVKQIRTVTEKNRDIIVIYPEARYSLIGTTAVLPKSLGKMAKLLKVPVVVLNMHGNYLDSPVWNLSKRKNRTEAEMTQIVTQGEIASLSVEEINERIEKAFIYDEYRWQKENKVRITYKNNAKGLHKVLYQCPSCMTEYETDSDSNRIWCRHCGKEWIMSELGGLSAVNAMTEFPHIPDWYEFERQQVRRQIEDNAYELQVDVVVDSLPNAKGYVRLGEAKLTHDRSGFRLEGIFEGKPFVLVKEPLSMYSCHIEYEYFGKGDCIDLSTMQDTYYVYPKGGKFSVTKIALATEELYSWHLENQEEQRAAL